MNALCQIWNTQNSFFLFEYLVISPSVCFSEVERSSSWHIFVKWNCKILRLASLKRHDRPRGDRQWPHCRLLLLSLGRRVLPGRVTPVDTHDIWINHILTQLSLWTLHDFLLVQILTLANKYSLMNINEIGWVRVRGGGDGPGWEAASFYGINNVREWRRYGRRRTPGITPSANSSKNLFNFSWRSQFSSIQLKINIHCNSIIICCHLTCFVIRVYGIN